MTQLPDSVMERIRSLHVERGGDYEWNQIIESNEWHQLTGGLKITGDALRKRVKRYENNPQRSGTRVEKHQSYVPSYTDVSTYDTSYSNNVFDINDVEQYTPVFDTEDIISDSRENYDLKMKIIRLEELLEQAGVPRPDMDNPELYRPYPAHLDDTSKWVEIQKQLGEDKDVVSAVVWSDLHIPDHSVPAIRLALKVLQHIQPDILFLNGDTFDFDSLSTFAKDRNRRYSDAIQEVVSIYNNLIDAIVKASPNTVIVKQRGNHDDRVDRWNNMSANPFADTTEEAFVQMVRANGRVLWLGQYQESHIGPLLVQHGKRVGENAAKNAVRDTGGAMPQTQGHGHLPTTYVKRVNDDASDLQDYRVVMSTMSGALCNIPPHYQRDSKQSKWLHSVILVHANMTGKDVNLQNVVFHRRKDGVLWCVVGDEIIFSDNKKGFHIE